MLSMLVTSTVDALTGERVIARPTRKAETAKRIIATLLPLAARNCGTRTHSYRINATIESRVSSRDRKPIVSYQETERPPSEDAARPFFLKNLRRNGPIRLRTKASARRSGGPLR